MKNKSKKLLFSQVQRGYTLVELIVVIAILALIMTLSIWAFQSNRDRTQLDAAAQIVMSSIREAQNMSMSGVTQIDSDTTDIYVPEQGYGIGPILTLSFVDLYKVEAPVSFGDDFYYPSLGDLLERTPLSATDDQSIAVRFNRPRVKNVGDLDYIQLGFAYIYFPPNESSGVIWAGGPISPDSGNYDIILLELISHKTDKSVQIKFYADTGVIELIDNEDDFE